MDKVSKPRPEGTGAAGSEPLPISAKGGLVTLRMSSRSAFQRERNVVPLRAATETIEIAPAKGRSSGTGNNEDTERSAAWQADAKALLPTPGGPTTSKIP